MSDFIGLQNRLNALAEPHGDAVEVQDRRGVGIVGISIYSRSGGFPSIHTEWMDDLDGLTLAEAHQALEKLRGQL